MIVVHQRRQTRHVGPADDQNPAGVLVHELRDLDEAHPQQRIKQDRQHRDHEQRAPIAQLIAHFAKQNQLDVGPGQDRGEGLGTRGEGLGGWTRERTDFAAFGGVITRPSPLVPRPYRRVVLRYQAEK